MYVLYTINTVEYTNDIMVNVSSILTMSTNKIKKLEIMKFIKIINREYNMVELPCGKVTNSIDIAQLDMNNEIGNLVVRYNNEQEIIKNI